ncbi:MAG: restriction endonuclease [Akkermansiaceae bacterium]|nr:restriction endonuclease [Akkermansiaceae bacterium]
MNLIDLLERVECVIGLQGHPRTLRQVLEAEMLGYFGLLPIHAAEQAEAFEKRIQQRIVEKQREMESTGVIPVVVLHHANNRRVVGSCWIDPDDDESVVAAKQGRAWAGQILEALRQLTPEEFEKFGSRILKELGAEQVRVTRRSGDNGVDFYGYLSLGGVMMHPPAICQLAHNIQLLFAGQAKHYPNSAIGPSTIREMIGAIALARFSVYSSDPDFFEEFKLLPYNPLLALVFTTGRFTKGALEIANAAGVIARSGIQLAIFLADRNVGIVKEGGIATFVPERFTDWLND